MKWVLFVLAGLVVIVCVIAIVGAMLPRDHVASRTVRLRRPPQDVWNAVAAETKKSSVPVDVVESDPPRRLVTRVTAAEKNFGGTWTITIDPASDGSTLTITEAGWVANPIFRFVSRFVMGHYASIDSVLRGVSQKS
jgi:hypothetical protein